MSILFMDGAERNSASQWTSFTGTINTGMTGNYCFRMYGGGSPVTSSHKLAAAQTTLYTTAKFTSDKLGFGPWLFLDSAGTASLSVVVNSSGKIEIRLGGSGGTVLATGTSTISINVMTLIEVYYKPLNSGGECTVKVDGATDATYSGDTTAGLENVQYFSMATTVTSNIMKFDDVVIGNSGWLGNQYIQLIVPTGAGDSTQWDPSTGANYACVDEVTASDTDYVSTNVADEVDLYALGNLTGTVASVTAINVCARMAYEGTPTPTKQKIAIKSTSEYYGSDVSPALTFADNFKLFELDPHGDIAWAESTVNALQAGVKSVA